MLNSPLRSKAALAMLAVGTFSYVTIEVMPIGLLTVMADELGGPGPRSGSSSPGTPSSLCSPPSRSPC